MQSECTVFIINYMKARRHIDDVVTGERQMELLDNIDFFPAALRFDAAGSLQVERLSDARLLFNRVIADQVYVNEASGWIENKAFISIGDGAQTEVEQALNEDVIENSDLTEGLAHFARYLAKPDPVTAAGSMELLASCGVVTVQINSLETQVETALFEICFAEPAKARNFLDWLGSRPSAPARIPKTPRVVAEQIKRRALWSLSWAIKAPILVAAFLLGGFIVAPGPFYNAYAFLVNRSHGEYGDIYTVSNDVVCADSVDMLKRWERDDADNDQGDFKAYVQDHVYRIRANQTFYLHSRNADYIEIGGFQQAPNCYLKASDAMYLIMPPNKA